MKYKRFYFGWCCLSLLCLSSNSLPYLKHLQKMDTQRMIGLGKDRTGHTIWAFKCSLSSALWNPIRVWWNLIQQNSLHSLQLYWMNSYFQSNRIVTGIKGLVYPSTTNPLLQLTLCCLVRPNMAPCSDSLRCWLCRSLFLSMRSL